LLFESLTILIEFYTGMIERELSHAGFLTCVS